MQAMTWQTHDGVEVFHMAALEAAGGVAAFFTGRRGGVSTRWDGGLNWSISIGDDPGYVAENRRRTLAILGLTPERSVIAGLVHGNRVVAVSGAAPGPGPRVIPDCDALITDEKGLALIVTAADCVPVFLYDPVRRAVGAVHAGWRGTVAGICAEAVAAMARTYGSCPGEIIAAVGPSIGPCCYEVDDVVAAPLTSYYGELAANCLTPVSGKAGKYMLDLWEANRQDLLRAGVGNAQISGACTACGVDRLFSHRAEAGTAGRGAAVIALI
jgi:polyphenol oxidase